MWFAVAIIGIIAIAAGITLLPHGMPSTNSSPPAMTAPAVPPSAAPAPPPPQH